MTQEDRKVADAIAYARRMNPPMKVFARELRLTLGLDSLSRQTIYGWESARVRVPASVLVASAQVAGVGVDELLRRSAARRRDALATMDRAPFEGARLVS